MIGQVWNYVFDFQFRLAPIKKGRLRVVYSNKNQIQKLFMI